MDLTDTNDGKIIISPVIQGDMEKRRILFEDIEKVVAHSQTTGERFFNPADSSYLASLRMDNITCWVRYKEKEDGFHIMNIYSHRMAIVKE